MMRTFSTGLVALTLMTAAAAAQAITAMESKFTVKDTTDRLAAELDKRGVKVAARIDHAAGAKAVGLDMQPTEVIMFGNPKLGTPLMLAQPSVAIELPMKMLIWQDKAGKVWVGYTAPSSLKERHKIAGQDEPLKMMAGALDGLAKAASGN